MNTPETAYRALSVCAERIGANNYVTQRAAWEGSPRRFRFTITEAHRSVVTAMLDVMNGRLSVNDAMGLLHTHDVWEQRFGKGTW